MLSSECRGSLTALSTASFCKRKVQLHLLCDFCVELLLLDFLTKASLCTTARTNSRSALLLGRASPCIAAPQVLQSDI